MPLALLFIATIIFVIYSKDMNIDTIVSNSPENIWLSSLFILSLFCAKGVILAIPIVIVKIAAGYLLPIVPAILVNLIGTTISYTIPYFMAKVYGANILEKFTRKNNKINDFIQKQRNHEFFVCFALRAVSCLPGEYVSMYLGAQKVSFRNFSLGSILGAIPHIIVLTIMGHSMNEPASPIFIVSVVLVVCMAVGSGIIYRKRRRKNNENNYHNKDKAVLLALDEESESAELIKERKQ